MNISLKDFQEEYVTILLDRLIKAKRYVRDGEAQGVLLAAPTGSGKTVMLTALMEDVLFGCDEFPFESDAVFLWLSDQPELNEQSRNRILDASNKFSNHHLVMVDVEFDAEVFPGGSVYFINTQKLASNSLLTNKKDRRQFTIWETIENTSKILGDKFYLVIDEAHRGMNTSPNNRREAQSIVQKFILGSPSDGLSAIKLILGISATPERFENLLANTDRHMFKVNVDAAKVRASGLIKDTLRVMIPNEDQPNDWSLLRAAAKHWDELRGEWRDYCISQNIKVVEPILVIQVEDARSGELTGTDLSTAISTLEEVMGDLSDEHLAHSFQEERVIELGNHRIRRLDPSKISNDSTVRVVFFKMALTTGWDCPRAEVMMSFRRAQDHTSIAQLIGRMVRTPLAERIHDSEMLNEVYLYLPYYDTQTVKIVVEKLASDADNVPATNVKLGNDFVQVEVLGELVEAYEVLKRKPTYLISEGRKLSDLRRLLRLGTLLTIDGIDAEALPRARNEIVTLLQNAKRKKIESDEVFRNALNDVGSIKIKPLIVSQADYSITAGEELIIEVSEANADDLYRRAKTRLGTDIVVEYMRREVDLNDSMKTKLEIFLLSQQAEILTAIERLSKQLISSFRDQHQTAIDSLISIKRTRYKEIWALSRRPEHSTLDLTKSINWPKEIDASEWPKHLFVRLDKRFATKLKEWEARVVSKLLELPDLECWFRNLDRKKWSLAYWYESIDGGYNLGYPDLIAIRNTSTGRKVEVYEPHGDHLSDGWRKTKGLAHFADLHADEFSRIAIVRIINEQAMVLDLCNEDIRSIALRMNNDGELNNLFRDYARVLN